MLLKGVRMVSRAVMLGLLIPCLFLMGCGTQLNGQAGRITSGPGEPDIPWASVPGTPMGDDVASLAVPCEVGDIAIELGRTGAWHGASTQGVELRNVSGNTCILRTPPGLLVVDSGVATPVGVNRRLLPLTLNAGETATALVAAPMSCQVSGRPQVADEFNVTATYLEGIVTLEEAYIPMACGTPVLDTWYDSVDTAATDSLARLDANATVPASFSEGIPATYTVTLKNPTTATISLDSCPSYRQTVSGSETFVNDVLRLNCDGVPKIGPGEELTFEMQVTLPTGTPPGPAKLGWHLEVPGGATTGSELIIH